MSQDPMTPPFSDRDLDAFLAALHGPGRPPRPVAVTVAIALADGTSRTATAILPADVASSTLVATSLGAVSGALAQVGVLTDLRHPTCTCPR